MKKSIKYVLFFLILAVLGVTGFFVSENWQAWVGFGSAVVVESESQDESEIAPVFQEKEAILSDLQIGDSNAPVTIVEYFSYFCGYCVKFHSETLPQIKEKYVDTGKVRFIFRSTSPLELGIAVLCAREQDKFLEYNNYLFDHAKEIKEADNLVDFARNIGLNDVEFVSCYNSEKYLEKARGWYEQSNEDFEKAGIPSEQQGTPAFFINNELLLGAHPFENFVKVIEEKLGE